MSEFEEAMPFPDSPRVLYEKNPLAEVICQLRFPTILRIDSEPPAAFQERIRQHYPLFRERRDQELMLPTAIAKRTGIEFGLRIESRAYEFVSADELWTISLTRDFLALTARRYVRWEEFREHLRTPFDSLLEIYSPAFFSRVGLRYRDVICRSTLGLEGVAWPELLQPFIAGELSSADVADHIEEAQRLLLVCLPDDLGMVRVRHGLERSGESGEMCYVIDSDFFSEERTEPEDALEVLNALNGQAGRLFRWCITDRLHNAMQPRPVDR